MHAVADGSFAEDWQQPEPWVCPEDRLEVSPPAHVVVGVIGFDCCLVVVDELQVDGKEVIPAQSDGDLLSWK